MSDKASTDAKARRGTPNRRGSKVERRDPDDVASVDKVRERADAGDGGQQEGEADTRVGIRKRQKEREPAAELAEPRAMYYFTVTSPLTALPTKRSDAGGPRGTRIHVSYGQGSTVTTKRDDYTRSWKRAPPALEDAKQLTEADELEWRRLVWGGITGKVLSGADFLLARLDGVLELDGRVTIRAADQTLIDATYWALVDLERDWVDEAMRSENPVRSLAKDGPQEAAVSPGYVKFVEGQLKGLLRANLCLRFETNTGPWASSAEAQDTTWTRESRLKHEKNVWKYRNLVRQQFYGLGTILFDNPERVTIPKEITIKVVAPAFDGRQP